MQTIGTKSNPEHLREIQREIVSAIITSADEMTLMGRKDSAKGGVYSECWHLSGGGVEEGEDNITALKREVGEETGIVDEAEITLADNQGKGATQKTLKDTGEKVWCNMNFNVYNFKINKNAEDMIIKPSDDFVELRWFNREELNNIQLTPPSQELFKKLGIIS